MSKKLDRLYRFLMEHQKSGATFTIDEAVDATEYEVSSLKTNFSKHLKGRWVDAADDQHFKVHDFASVSRAVFADAMSQKTRLTFADEDEWREQVHRLLSLGVQQGYPVREALEAIVQDLGVG